MADVATAGNAVAHFSPDDFVITPIRRAVQNDQTVAIAVEGVGELIIVGKQGEFLQTAPLDLRAWCTAPLGRIRVTVLEPDAATALGSERPGRNVDELLWTAGFFASAGRLMEGCFTYDVVEMPHWPNLSRLPHTPNTFRIVAMFTRHTTSIALAHRLLKIEATELYQVYSAARCAGLARVVNARVQEPALKPHRQQTLLSQLMAKISSL